MCKAPVKVLPSTNQHLFTFSPDPFPHNLPLSLTDWFHGFYFARVRKSLALKILVSAADLASSAGFWAHFNIVTYLLTYLPSFFTGRMPFLSVSPNRQCQSTEGKCCCTVFCWYLIQSLCDVAVFWRTKAAGRTGLRDIRNTWKSPSLHRRTNSIVRHGVAMLPQLSSPVALCGIHAYGLRFLLWVNFFYGGSRLRFVNFKLTNSEHVKVV